MRDVRYHMPAIGFSLLVVGIMGIMVVTLLVAIEPRPIEVENVRPVWAREGMLARYHFENIDTSFEFSLRVVFVEENYATIEFIPHRDNWGNYIVNWCFRDICPLRRTRDRVFNENWIYDNRTLLLIYGFENRQTIRMVKQYV